MQFKFRKNAIPIPCNSNSAGVAWRGVTALDLALAWRWSGVRLGCPGGVALDWNCHSIEGSVAIPIQGNPCKPGGDLLVRGMRSDRFGTVLDAFWSIPVGLVEISVYGECGLSGFERSVGRIPIGWEEISVCGGSGLSVPVRTRAGTVKAPLGIHPTHPHSLGMEVSQASRLVCVCVCVCVCVFRVWVGRVPTH